MDRRRVDGQLGRRLRTWPGHTVEDDSAVATLVRSERPPPEGLAMAPTLIDLQHRAGNRAVSRMIVQRRATAPAPPLPATAKVIGDEEELAKGRPDCGAGCGCTRCRSDRATDREVDVVVAETAATRDLDASAAGLAKATTSVGAGAAPSQGLGPGVYGLTYPEKVTPTIGAKLDKTAGTWSPKVVALRGTYSLQARLLPGQTQITGPGGNTTQANCCDQATNLQSLGNTAGNGWYVLAAVRRHEQVHAKKFGKALKTAEPAITAALEAVTIPHVKGMTAGKAVKALKADPSYQAAVIAAQSTWLAAVLVEVAGDHAGPTDAAERTVTEPMRRAICNHAKHHKWPPCPAC
jgi:hypothetical protein